MSGSVAYTLKDIDDNIKSLKKEIEKWELRKKQAQNLLNLVKIKRRTNINSKAGLNNINTELLDAIKQIMKIITNIFKRTRAFCKLFFTNQYITALPYVFGTSSGPFC